MSISLSTVKSAVISATPLSIAVIPWGVLCGTLCIEAGMSAFQAQLMSAIIFAGAAQISGIAILGAGGSWLTLLNSTFMISVRHVLYSAAYKEHIASLPLWKRLIFAFLLTDEMFAIAKVEESKSGKFDYWHAVIAGFAFYSVWNMATFAGIFFANSLDNISEMGFDFAIVATFIAMIVPMVRSEIFGTHHRPSTSQIASHPVLVAVLVSALMALVFAYLNIGQGLIFSTLMGMAVGAFLNRDNVDADTDATVTPHSCDSEKTK